MSRVELRQVRELGGTFHLPGSKSESNRALILRSVSRGAFRPENLSRAEDTQTLIRCLDQETGNLDVGDAGTAMRFLTAYLAFQPQDRVLTGSARMQERPIGPLVEALRCLGADIQYLGKEGFPPLLISGKNAKWKASSVSIPGHISSQYISALMMVAPNLPAGLDIELTGEILSRPYIELTQAMLGRAGIQVQWVGNRIHIPKGVFRPVSWRVESDWSAASYAYALLALAQKGKLFLPGLRKDTEQGDAAIQTWMETLGVHTKFGPEGAEIEYFPTPLPPEVAWDFSKNPDLAQSLLPCLAALGISGTFTGLSSLKIKETDRIAALQTELRKIGWALMESSARWILNGNWEGPQLPILTYGDHRMAMGFAALSVRCPGMILEDPEVVNKSFPGFWEELAAVGFEVLKH